MSRKRINRAAALSCLDAASLALRDAPARESAWLKELMMDRPELISGAHEKGMTSGEFATFLTNHGFPVSAGTVRAVAAEVGLPFRDAASKSKKAASPAQSDANDGRVKATHRAEAKSQARNARPAKTPTSSVAPNKVLQAQQTVASVEPLRPPTAAANEEVFPTGPSVPGQTFPSHMRKPLG